MVDEFIARERVANLFNPSLRGNVPDRAQQTDACEKTRSAYSVGGFAYAVKDALGGVLTSILCANLCGSASPQLVRLAILFNRRDAVVAQRKLQIRRDKRDLSRGAGL